MWVLEDAAAFVPRALRESESVHIIYVETSFRYADADELKFLLNYSHLDSEGKVSVNHYWPLLTSTGKSGKGRNLKHLDDRLGGVSEEYFQMMRKCIIVDDVVGSGSTLAYASAYMMKQGYDSSQLWVAAQELVPKKEFSGVLMKFGIVPFSYYKDKIPKLVDCPYDLLIESRLRMDRAAELQENLNKLVSKLI